METKARELRTRGVVVGHRHRKRHGMDNKVSVLVHPVVRFETGVGESVEFESGLGSNIPPKVGEEVEVFYDPSRPDDARIAASSALRFTKWHIIIAIVILAVPAVFFLLFFLLFVVIAFI